jgi:transcription elongation factor Elf1
MDKEGEVLKERLIEYNVAYAKSTKDSKSFLSPFPCPRCGDYNMPNNTGLAAVSRISDDVIEIYVCTECGQEESVDDLTHDQPYIENIKNWEIAKNINN